MRARSRRNGQTLVAVGDVVLNRPRLDEPFRRVRDLFRAADFTLINLESPISEGGSSVIHQIVTHRQRPESVEVLRDAGVDAVSFANSHCMDYGPVALLDTLRHLKKGGIGCAGAGPNAAEAAKPIFLERDGTSLAFLSYCTILKAGFAAGPGSPGMAGLRVATYYEIHQSERYGAGQPGRALVTVTILDKDDVRQVQRDVRNAKRRADVVVVAFHWGISFNYDMVSYQRELAHATIDAGADLIIGHHPHCLKGLEVYQGRVIAYSLGNFIYDMPNVTAEDRHHRAGLLKHVLTHGLRWDPSDPYHPFPDMSRDSVILQGRIAGGRIRDVSLLPAYIGRGGIPAVHDGARGAGRRILSLLDRLSHPMATQVVIRDGRGIPGPLG